MKQLSPELLNLNGLIQWDWIQEPEFVDLKKESDVNSFLTMKEFVKIFNHLNSDRFLTKREIDALVTFYGICMDQIDESSGSGFCLEVQILFLKRMKAYKDIAEDNDLFEFLANGSKFIDRFV